MVMAIVGSDQLLNDLRRCTKGISSPSSSVHFQILDVPIAGQTPYFVPPLVRLLLHILLEQRSRFAGDRDHGLIDHEDPRRRVVGREGDLKVRGEESDVPKGIVRILSILVKIESAIEAAEAISSGKELRDKGHS